MGIHQTSYHKVVLLIPSIDTDDENLKYYYDFSQSKSEYKSVFDQLNIEWIWLELNLANYQNQIDRVIHEHGLATIIFFNLCDGDEINGAPGISVINYLEKLNAIYTGANPDFYKITTSKIIMKQYFDHFDVPTPKWAVINKDNINEVFELLGKPIIIKPAVSGGSMGVSVRNVVSNYEDCLSCIEEIESGYRGWNLSNGGIIAEEYIDGPEYTSLIVGDSRKDNEIKTFNIVERVFHKSLKPEEKFLSFDRLWETYETESAMPENGFFFEYHPVDDTTNHLINELTMHAYRSVEGSGYSRIDIRQDSKSGKYFVLEANAQCGLSEDENYTSIGAILRVSKKSFTELCELILNDTLTNHNSIQYEGLRTTS
jgi:D-alanine-D-alanine ligase